MYVVTCTPHITHQTPHICAHCAGTFCALQERDWGDSSAEEDGPDPREQLWAALLAQNPQRQPQSEGAQEQLLPPTQQGTALEESQHNAGAGAGVAAAGGPVGAQAAVLALTAAAAAVGGPRLRASAAQAPLAPGLMLAQAPAGEHTTNVMDGAAPNA